MFPRPPRFAFYFTFMVMTLAAGTAEAGAWTQAKGSGQVILNSFYYTTDTFYNPQGNERPQPDYDKVELNPYIEYGLADGVTIGANLSLQYVMQDLAGGGTSSNVGIGDSEFFVRQRLWQQDGFVFSAEPMIKLPSPESSSSMPKIGSTHPDAGLGFSAGYGFGEGNLHHFANLDAGYRHRFGAPKDRIILAGTLGYSATPEWMILPQIFATYRTSTPSAAAFTLSSGDDYNLVKLQLSAVYKLNEDISLQAGAFSHAIGKNTGAGEGILLSIWSDF